MKTLLALFLLFASSGAPQADEIAPPLVRLQQFKPLYFLVGKPDTKIQLSFKLQAIRDVDLYFAYTQLMMWDIIKPSAPMRDVNYNPEAFYRIFIKKESTRWIDVGVFEHESNGRDGTASRAWNRFYLLFHSMQKLGERAQFTWSFKAWVPYAYHASNPDFPKYRGVWEVQMTLSELFTGSFIGDNDLSLRFYPGGKYYTNPIFGGQELTLRGKTSTQDLRPVAVIQVFHGYGENMLDAADQRFGIRAGVGF